MFDLYGRTGRRNYLIWSCVSLVLLIGFVLLKDSALRSVEFFLTWPLALIIFSFVPPAVRRARDIGAPGWLGLIVPLLFAADFHVFMSADGPSPFDWRFIEACPAYAVLGLLCALVLGTLPTAALSAEDGQSHLTRDTIFTLATSVLVGFVALRMREILPLKGLPRDVDHTLNDVANFQGVVLAAYAGLVVGMAIQLGRPGSDANATATDVRLPFYRLALATFILALVAGEIAIVNTGPSMYLPTGVSQILYPFLIGPTLFVYFLPVVAVALFMKRLWLPGFVASLVFVLLISTWAVEFWRGAQVSTETAALKLAAASAGSRVESYPSILRVAPEVASRRFHIEGITSRIEGRDSGKLSIENLAERSKRSLSDSDLPADYIYLRLGRVSSYFNPREVEGSRVQSYALSRVTNGTETVIAEYYDAATPQPFWLPVVNDGGWVSGAVGLDRPNYGLQDFVDDALAGAHPQPPPPEPEAE